MLASARSFATRLFPCNGPSHPQPQPQTSSTASRRRPREDDATDDAEPARNRRRLAHVYNVQPGLAQQYEQDADRVRISRLSDEEVSDRLEHANGILATSLANEAAEATVVATGMAVLPLVRRFFPNVDAASYMERLRTDPTLKTAAIRLLARHVFAAMPETAQTAAIISGRVIDAASASEPAPATSSAATSARAL